MSKNKIFFLSFFFWQFSVYAEQPKVITSTNYMKEVIYHVLHREAKPGDEIPVEVRNFNNLPKESLPLLINEYKMADEFNKNIVFAYLVKKFKQYEPYVEEPLLTQVVDTIFFHFESQLEVASEYTKHTKKKGWLYDVKDLKNVRIRAVTKKWRVECMEFSKAFAKSEGREYKHNPLYDEPPEPEITPTPSPSPTKGLVPFQPAVVTKEIPLSISPKEPAYESWKWILSAILLCSSAVLIWKIKTSRSLSAPNK